MILSLQKCDIFISWKPCVQTKTVINSYDETLRKPIKLREMYLWYRKVNSNETFPDTGSYYSKSLNKWVAFILLLGKYVQG